MGTLTESGSSITQVGLSLAMKLWPSVARHILKNNPGQKIVGDVKCSDELYHDIKRNGGIPIMWKTGHSLIKEKNQN